MTDVKFTTDRNDFHVTWFSRGSGGQKQNKKPRNCRLKHIPTGVIKIGTSYATRDRNRAEALRAIADDPFFKAYCEKKLREIEDGKSLEEKVDELMTPENIQVQVKNEEGQWIDEQN